MSTQKIIATALIITAGYFFGVIYGDIKKRSINELNGMLKLLIYMKSKISYTRTAIHEIIFTFEDKSLDECGFLKCFNDSDRESAGNAWQRACSTLSVSEKIKNELCALGGNLGLLDAENQINQISLCESFLLDEKTEIEKFFVKRQKSYKSLGVLAGAMLAIILY